MATKHTTTHSTGLTATRTSEKRIYTHAVWNTKTAEQVRATAQETLDSIRRELKRLKADLAENGSTTRHRGVAQVEKWIAGYEKDIPTLEAKVNNAKPESWCIGWCGSLELANKRAGQERAHGYITEITEAIHG